MPPNKKARTSSSSGGPKPKQRSTPSSTVTSAANLRWRKVPRPSQASYGALDHEGGIMDLEEVDGVEVIYEEIEGGGKKVTFRQRDPVPGEELEVVESDEEDLIASGSMLDEEEDEARKQYITQGVIMDEDEDDDGVEYEAWGGIQEEEPEAAEEEATAEEVADEETIEDEPSTEAGPSTVVAPALTKKEKAKAKKEAAKKAAAEKAEEVVEAEPVAPVDESFDDALLPHWSSLPIHSLLKRSIFNMGFFKPSPIQATSLPFGLDGRDIVGVAETGSGKTLAYGLPILSHCFSQPPPAPLPVKTSKGPAPRQPKRAMQALILAPTRELALQVCQHLQKAVDAALIIPNIDGEAKAEGDEEAKKPSGIPRVSVGAIVGGMSAQKQKRVLERGVDILVATPGRLWDLIGENEDIAQSIRNISYLVIDEADRMIETGHFVELEQIVALTHRSSQTTAGSQSDAKPRPGSTAEEDLAFVKVSEKAMAKEQMQTFVYSATLSKELQRNLKRFSGKPREGKKKKATTLDDLFEKLDFRDSDPEIIDLSSEDGMVKTLQESKIECMANEKDLYLYYFLLRYPGRSLIFFGSIDGIRRAVPLLELLKFPIFPLHSQLQQKQRLKNLDRFKASPNGILLATDIAARGLDIPSVDHVIHYQLPRSADVYVHRSGRTARAKMVGFSLQLCSPEEKRVQRALMKSLGRDDELPELPIEHGMLDKLKQRIVVARKIDSANHKVKKDNHEKSWIKEAAEALEIDLDSDNMPTDEDDDEDNVGARGNAKSNSIKVANLKGELRMLMSQPLVARGISQKYITSGSRKIVDDLVQGKQHTAMMGMSTNSAASDAALGKSKKRKAVETPSTA